VEELRRTQRSGGCKGLPTARIITAERSLAGVRSLVLFLGGEGGEGLDTEVAFEGFVCVVGEHHARDRILRLSF
jgi:hypothetical protein